MISRLQQLPPPPPATNPTARSNARKPTCVASQASELESVKPRRRATATSTGASTWPPRRSSCPPDAIYSSDRIRVVAARHVAMWLLRDAGMSLPAIGATLGRDHTSVPLRVRRVERDGSCWRLRGAQSRRGAPESESCSTVPHFGGKRRAAPTIWRALGDPGGYVEPFAGSAAVLLASQVHRSPRRNHQRCRRMAGQHVARHPTFPGEVAHHATGPVTEIDYHARLAWLQGRRGPDLVSWLEGDPEAHDPKAAGWWLYVAACGIGDPWGGGRGVSSTATCATRVESNAGQGVH